MLWHQHATMYQESKKAGLDLGMSPINFLTRYASDISNGRWNAPGGASTRANAEVDFYRGGRPFYNIWPSVAQAFSEVSLEVPTASIIPKFLGMPCSLELRFSHGGEVEVAGKKLRSILACRINTHDDKPGLALWIDTGELTKDEGMRVLDWICFPIGIEKDQESGFYWLDETTVSDHLEGPDFDWLGKWSDREVLLAGIKVLIATVMVKDDPEYARRIILERDEGQLRLSPERAKEFIAKAEKKGIKGWHIGRDIQVSPHYRRPHFAIRWTGKGRTVAKLTPIKGCMVRGIEQVTQVPTGYEGVTNV